MEIGAVDTKRIESDHFKLFRQMLPEFPEGEVWHEDEPDFLIHTDHGILGIEHRQLFKPQRDGKAPLQAVESQIDDIVALAQEHAELRGMPPVYVGLFFDLHQSLPKKQRIDLAREIASFIHTNLPEPDQSLVLELDSGYGGVKPEALDFPILIRNQHRSRHHWQSSEAGSVMKDSREVLQAATDEKATKIKRYLANCNECWLLIVSDGLKPSSFVHADKATKEHLYTSPFSRTYFLDCAYGDLIELKTIEP